ncbi:MAG TPA: TolC family protein [Gemmatimonadaceae bacterium]|jgi:outer membrane protein|nr:TolC family protein [Gemmatimonadaceae bacterium]
MPPAVIRGALALVLAPALLRGQAPDTLAARPIPLPQAVSLAQENALGAVQARGQVRTAESSVRAARAALFPSINLTMGQVNQSGDRFDSQGRLVPFLAPQPWSYSTGIQSSLNLFDGGRRLNEIKRTRSDVGAAAANEVNERFNIALQVKTQYYGILAARESEAAARAQLQQAQEQLKASIARTAAGVATLSDSLRSVVAVGNAQLALITARNNLRVASAALTRLVGSETPVTALPADTADLALTPIDSATLAGLLDEGPAVKEAEAQLTSARTSVRTARTPYLPTIDLTYSRSGNGFDKFYGIGDKSLAYTNNFSIRLAYPLWNNYQREDALNRARVQADVAEATVRDTRLAAQQTFVQQLGALRTAQQRIALQQVSVQAAQEDLRVQQQRYALGASTLLDVLTSQSTLDAARSALIQARQDFRVARAQLEALVGRELQ